MYDLEIIKQQEGSISFVKPTNMFTGINNLLQRVILLSLSEGSLIKPGLSISALPLAIAEERLRVLDILKPSVDPSLELQYSLITDKNPPSLRIEVSIDGASATTTIKI